MNNLLLRNSWVVVRRRFVDVVDEVSSTSLVDSLNMREVSQIDSPFPSLVAAELA